MYLQLKKYGLNDFFIQQANLYEGFYLARIIEQHRDLYKVISEQGELHANLSGKMIYNTTNLENLPAVGDWVMIDKIEDKTGNAIIHNVLTRTSSFTRKAAGTGNKQQIIAANIDVIFICMSLNADFNLRRLERYLAIAWDSMAKPVIILTKADLCQNTEEKLNEVLNIAFGTETIACSSENGYGLEQISKMVEQGKTIAFLGSSGVGKSTLINHLMNNDIMTTQTIRNDDKGKHTTTHRQLLLLPNGGIVIDTPGMRELRLSTGNIDKTFEDIEELSTMCKYKNCSHTDEPNCMIQNALTNGTLDQSRFASYLKLKREVTYEGLNSRQLEQEKINNMFGSKKEMKQLFKQIKKKNKR